MGRKVFSKSSVDGDLKATLAIEATIEVHAEFDGLIQEIAALADHFLVLVSGKIREALEA